MKHKKAKVESYRQGNNLFVIFGDLFHVISITMSIAFLGRTIYILQVNGYN